MIPTYVEREFSFSLGGDRVRGRWDRVDIVAAEAGQPAAPVSATLPSADVVSPTLEILGPERVTITDYKSSDVRDPVKARQRARDSLQLQIYAMGYEAMTGRLPDEIALHFLESGLVGKVAVDPKRLAKARDKIAQAAAGIRARDYTAEAGLRGLLVLRLPRYLSLEHRPLGEPVDSMIMEARDRAANLALLAAAAAVWALVGLVVTTRDPQIDPVAGFIGAALIGLALALTFAPLLWLSVFGRHRRIAYQGDWLRAARRGGWVGIVAAVLVVLRLQGLLELPIALFMIALVARGGGDPVGRALTARRRSRPFATLPTCRPPHPEIRCPP